MMSDGSMLTIVQPRARAPASANPMLVAQWNLVERRSILAIVPGLSLLISLLQHTITASDQSHQSNQSIASIESINRDSCWYVPQEYTITHGRKQALARGIDGNHAPELFIISQQRIDVLCPQADLLGVHGVEAHDGGGGGEEAAGDE